MDNSKPLPRIMYDQSQFTPIYFMGPNGIWLSDRAYRTMGELSGYAPSVWYTYTQNKPVSFWFGAFDEEALQKEAEVGFTYFRNPHTRTHFEDFVTTSLERVTKFKKIFFSQIDGHIEELLEKEPEKLVRFIQNVHDFMAETMARHILLEPEQFYKFEAYLEKHLEDADLVFVASAAHRLTLFGELQKSVLAHDTQTIERLGFLTWGILGGKRTTSDTVIENAMEEKQKMAELEVAIKRRQSLIETHQGEEAWEIADAMGVYGVFRFDLQTIELCVLKYIDVILNAVCVKNGLEKDAFTAYEYAEVLELMRRGTHVDVATLERRQLGCLIRYSTESTDVLYAEEAHQEIKELLEFREQEIKKTQEVKGQTASWPDKGVSTVVGECFIMTTAFGADKAATEFKEGQILIATQTHPHIVPIMRTAAGIVTDEGGIICHAAIVSRELGKPCIIGTRLGTKIFKTGDQIEMNLQTGVVRKV